MATKISIPKKLEAELRESKDELAYKIVALLDAAQMKEAAKPERSWVTLQEAEEILGRCKKYAPFYGNPAAAARLQKELGALEVKRDDLMAIAAWLDTGTPWLDSSVPLLTILSKWTGWLARAKKHIGTPHSIIGNAPARFED